MSEGGTRLRSWRERIGAPLKEVQNDAPPLAVKDAAYWQSRCWRSGCENLAETDERRWRGRYCPACLTLLAADAERIAVEFGVSA